MTDSFESFQNTSSVGMKRTAAVGPINLTEVNVFWLKYYKSKTFLSLTCNQKTDVALMRKIRVYVLLT